MSRISKLIPCASALAFVTAGISVASAQQVSPAPQTAPSTGTRVPATEELEEIIVTGSSIRGVQPTGSNLVSLSNDDIKVIGAPTTPDLLASVPLLNSFNTAPKASLDGFGSFAPGLRSLPTSATLVLMNGHRLVGAAANETNPDYPQLPALAIERVEIVADGASAIYGSDAIAGVVNFVTRKRYSGAEASVRYGVADDHYSTFASGLVGQDWGTGSILAAYQYTENDNITGGDRDYRSLDYRSVGGVDARSMNCPTPNVMLLETGAVTYAAPDLLPNTTNYCDYGAVADLFPKSRLHSIFVTGQQDLGDRFTVWGEVLYSDRSDEIRVAGPAQTVFITAANPFFAAPPGSGALGEIVLFRPDNLFGSDHLENTDETKVANSSFGVDVRLPRDLKLSVYGTFDWAKNDAYIPRINPVALALAAAGTTPETALDPFGTGTNPDVAAAITDFATDVSVRQRTSLGAIKIDGPLVDLPGGQLKVAAGAEYRRETFSQRGVVGATPVPEDLSRNIRSVFAELFVPIFGAANAAPGFQRLSLSLSGRYDDYSDFGSTSNPKIGLNWDPINSVTLRGTYGRSFRAPGVRQVGATVGSVFYDAATAAVVTRDPTRGDAQVNTIQLIGGNRDLQPEEARTYSVGFDWFPNFLPDFGASVTFYDIEFTQAIGTPPISLIFSDPTFAGNVYRNPTPEQLAALLALATPVNLPTPLPEIGNVLDQRLGNFGVRNTNGLDFDLSYRWSTNFGAIFTGLAGNHILEFDTQLSPSAPVANALRLGVPKTTLRGTAGVQAGPVTFASFINYRDGITNTFNTPTGTSEFKADSYMTVDLRVTWTLPEVGLATGTELALQVNDVFDEEPPFFPGTDGIGGAYNPIGRFIAVNLRKVF